MEYKCDYCGYEGYCYGTITSEGGIAPWCPKYGRNNKLTEVNKEETKKHYSIHLNDYYIL